MGNLDDVSQHDREDLTRRSADLGLAQYWAEREIIEDPKFRTRAVPFHWKWRDMHPLLARAADIVPMEDAYRRALLFVNPGLRPKPWMTTTIYGGCSWYNPGESAEVHRHPPSASRFVLSGDGGFTAVEGEKCTMQRGDLILTPGGTWHNHGNEGKEPVIWIDILDVPVADTLNNAWTMDYDYFESGGDGAGAGAGAGAGLVKRTVQAVSKPDDYSVRAYSMGGIKPRFIDHRRGKGQGSPMYVYRWKDTLTALERMRDFPADPCDGISIEYVNPVTGEPVLPTLSYGVQLFQPGQKTDFQRKSASTVFCAIKGRGVTEMDGARIVWEENDVFVVPSWTWYRHLNPDPGQDLMLYVVSDEPTLAKLGYLRSQRRTADGQVIERTA